MTSSSEQYFPRATSIEELAVFFVLMKMNLLECEMIILRSTR